jgi:hypothetical protein
MDDQDHTLANDILRGAEAIGAEVGLNARRAFAGLQAGWLPGWKEGGLWCSTRSALKAHYKLDNTPSENQR